MRKMNLSVTMKKHIYNHKKPQKQTVSQLSLIKHSLERTSYTRESLINGLGELRNKKTRTQFVLYAVPAVPQRVSHETRSLCQNLTTLGLRLQLTHGRRLCTDVVVFQTAPQWQKVRT